ncbi:hypothetical protein K0M31_002470 [Melipona bicolor]|uniref:Uncharacterized protein n=1 Tax=Melipona bicolor TaxID=60889 RepID=A0AA40GI82_9HYME|nr:hypothetical protein K0M31_002470 [Melipona bicolor]
MESIEFKKKPECRDLRNKLRTSPDRSRPNSYKQDNSFCEMSNTVRNNPNVVRQNLLNDVKKENLSQSNTTRPESAGAKLRFVHSNYPSKSLDPNLNDQIVINRERVVSTKQDYPEDFVSKDTSRNSSKNQKSHWQRTNDVENHIDEILQRDRRFSRFDNSRNESAANSNEVSRDWIEPTPSRIRSRTYSPPVDRQKKTRSLLKNLYETETRQDNESQNDEYSKFSRLRDANSDRSVDRRFVDRAVDKDSLSDLQNVCTSAEQISKLTDQVEKSNVRSNFWEFIPLDESDEKYKRIPENKEKITYQPQISLDNKSYLIMKSSAKDSDVRRWKDRFLQRHSKNSGSCNDPSLIKPQVKEIDNNKGNLSAYTLHNEQPSNNEAKEKSNPNFDKDRATGPNVYKNFKVVDSTKSQSKLVSKITFGWTNKTNRYLKRSGSASKDENDDKKKRITNAGISSSVTDDQKVRTNIVERTAACLKRKLNRSENREVSNQHSPIVVKKKIRSEEFGHSKLPIRVGNRLRSSNPMTKNQFNFKYVSREENKEKETNEEPCRFGSISARSRTKPRIKPSVIVGEAIDFADTSKNFQSGGSNPENKSKVKDPLANDPKAESNLIEDRIGNRGGKENFKNEKLETNIENKDDTEKMLNVEENERKYINRGREMDYNKGLTNRSGLKEKCCFHLNAEQNVTYNDYCNKEHRNLGSFRSRKPAAIKTQF